MREERVALVTGRRSPRSEGIWEQLDRAQAFLREAKASKDQLFRFRHAIAAAYFGRAVIELMLEAAAKEEVSRSREELEGLLREVLPRYNLIEKIRIHDFHRFGLTLHQRGVLAGGPVKLKVAKAKGSTAAIALGPTGLIKTATGASKIVEERVLLTREDRVLDDETGEWLEIDKAVAEFVTALPAAIDRFESLADRPGVAMEPPPGEIV